MNETLVPLYNSHSCSVVIERPTELIGLGFWSIAIGEKSADQNQSSL